MKKSYKLTDLDCAHCAQKMEDAIRKLPGVTEVSVNFLSEKFTLTADEAVFDKVLADALAICQKIEPDCKVIVK